MNKDIKLEKAKKIVRLNKIKEDKKVTKWHMFKEPQCCEGQRVWYGGEHSGGYVSRNRCDCSKIKTERFEKFLKKKAKMDPKDFLWKMSKFYDNNSHLNSSTNTPDRSW